MNAPRPRADAPADDRRELISALTDGDPQALDAGCALWRDDPEARRTWHAYHLIGDVMRSSELASRPARDAAFLAAVRERLAQEPVVLAPQPVPAARRRRPMWLMPAAAAAGFVAVAGVLVVVRMSEVPAGGAVVAGASAAAGGLVRASTEATRPAPPETFGPMIRDPQLDRLLAAHRGAMVSGAVAVPGAVPRSVEVMSPVTPAVAPVAR
jgi:sigma-E factor negative regulatory protein RseA